MEGAGPTDEELLALITETLVGPYRPRGLLPDAKPMSIIRLTDGQIRVVWTDGVITDARPRTYASRTGNRTHAMPTSWRPYSHDHFWQDHSVVITSEGGGSGRRAYEVFVNGWVIATRPRLDEAKLAAEAHVGKPLAFKQERLEPYEVDHYYWGPTTEFSSPTTIWTADV
jgi:hypothetical protein